MDLKSRPLNKNQKVRGQVRTTFSDAPKSVLTIGQNIFVLARLKLVLCKFWCHFFLSYIFFDCGPVFRGDTQAIEQKPIRFPATNLYAKSLDKKMFKNNHYSRSLQDPEN